LVLFDHVAEFQNTRACAISPTNKLPIRGFPCRKVVGLPIFVPPITASRTSIVG
jgi:hypothetical protein